MLFITKKDKEALKNLSKLQKEAEQKGHQKKLRSWKIGLTMMFVGVSFFLLGLRFSGAINTVPLVFFSWITIGLAAWAALTTYLIILIKLSGRFIMDKEKENNYKIKQTSPEFLKKEGIFSKK